MDLADGDAQQAANRAEYIRTLFARYRDALGFIAPEAARQTRKAFEDTFGSLLRLREAGESPKLARWDAAVTNVRRSVFTLSQKAEDYALPPLMRMAGCLAELPDAPDGTVPGRIDAMEGLLRESRTLAGVE